MKLCCCALSLRARAAGFAFLCSPALTAAAPFALESAGRGGYGWARVSAARPGQPSPASPAVPAVLTVGERGGHPPRAGTAQHGREQQEEEDEEQGDSTGQP